MERYIALLRGINVGGNNKIAMNELKIGFEGLGYEKVVTYLNSGNVIFSTAESKPNELANQIETMIFETFGLRIPVLVIPQSEVLAVLQLAPSWWGSEDKSIYDNLIFLFPELSDEQFSKEMGPKNAGYEKVQSVERAVFWSFIRKENQKTNWWAKTAKASIRNQITIRTANTVRKIVEM